MGSDRPLPGLQVTRSRKKHCGGSRPRLNYCIWEARILGRNSHSLALRAQGTSTNTAFREKKLDGNKRVPNGRRQGKREKEAETEEREKEKKPSCEAQHEQKTALRNFASVACQRNMPTTERIRQWWRFPGDPLPAFMGLRRLATMLYNTLLTA